MSTAIGTYIRERRQDLGLSQDQLAVEVGEPYSQSDISRLERGLIELPRLRTISRLAAALDVPVGDLLIASGWFNDEHVVPIPTAGGTVDLDALKIVLNKIETELDIILELERQAQSRSDRLRAMIRELHMMSGLAVTMTEHEGGG